MTVETRAGSSSSTLGMLFDDATGVIIIAHDETLKNAQSMPPSPLPVGGVQKETVKVKGKIVVTRKEGGDHNEGDYDAGHPFYKDKDDFSAQSVTRCVWSMRRPLG